MKISLGRIASMMRDFTPAQAMPFCIETRLLSGGWNNVRRLQSQQIGTTTSLFHG
ncbi:hypothetical protein FHW68_000318 [Pseudomonas sp. Tn43]|uniref:hypothetical protein n=1 Tax=Pseudomonas sp. Tn43 TaxID=701213 RepID=UPI001614CF3C|nr:hypothetical protein [Pseudomonas sp. Tn43]MBB3238846.1 hypothetical protein [Pseudomonas sp. Tn43]